MIHAGNLRTSIRTAGPMPCVRLMRWLDARKLGVVRGPRLNRAEGWLLDEVFCVLWSR